MRQIIQWIKSDTWYLRRGSAPGGDRTFAPDFLRELSDCSASAGAAAQRAGVKQIIGKTAISRKSTETGQAERCSFGLLPVGHVVGEKRAKNVLTLWVCSISTSIAPPYKKPKSFNLNGARTWEEIMRRPAALFPIVFALWAIILAPWGA